MNLYLKRWASTEQFKCWNRDNRLYAERVFIVWHGTDCDFDYFALAHCGRHYPQGTIGFHFTEDRRLAQNFAKHKWWVKNSKYRQGANIRPYFIRMKNPFITIPDMHRWDSIYQRVIKRDLMNRGYDGIVMLSSEGTYHVNNKIPHISEYITNQYILFTNDNIRSAISFC